MDRPVRSWSISAKEYGRGIVGGIIFSLPIVYTMEMWWAGFTLPPEKLLVNVLVTLALLLGYNYFCGLRSGESFWEELARICRRNWACLFDCVSLFMAHWKVGLEHVLR